ncbi:MAG: hypothetical protein JWQ71_3356 [Pedosphaera sp.]|nr:hypothetical protein [Pedosphaera sp.]
MVQVKSPMAQAIRAVALIFFLTLGCLSNLFARDVFVMLSGGDSPLDNNYSQYLQARSVAAYFEKNYPRDSVWTFFGAGNVEGQKPIFGDVRRQVKRSGLLLDTWLPGSLPHNLPARHDLILRTFREEILPAVAEGGTLYLFVGDHGSRTPGKGGESIISLWSLDRDPKSERGWRSSDDESLGVSEFRQTLLRGIGKGRVVFCMTQCHAGGFHYLAVSHEMTPNPKWFTDVPEWAVPKEARTFPPAAGFTATDEFSPASGCDPAPNPDDWAGYERFIPENLLGMDLFTSERTGKGLRSFAEAHTAATLVDSTIDKPYSTSEQYLERWANLIETRLAKEPKLTSTIKKRIATYQRTVDGATPKGSDAAFRERQALFQRFIKKLTEQDAAIKKMLLTGTRKELEMVIDPDRDKKKIPTRKRAQAQAQKPGQGSGRGGGASERRKLWNETVRPAWKTAVEANQVANLPVAVRDFEKYLLSKEAAGSNYFLSGQSLKEEIFWRSGYSNPQTVDPAKAEAIVRWGAERRAKIIAWAKNAENGDVRAAAEKLSQGRSRQTQYSDSDLRGPEPLSDKTAAERTLFYRRVLAAWEFLLAVNERPALARLHELIELERTPLPQPK